MSNTERLKSNNPENLDSSIKSDRKVNPNQNFDFKDQIHKIRLSRAEVEQIRSSKKSSQDGDNPRIQKNMFSKMIEYFKPEEVQQKGQNMQFCPICDEAYAEHCFENFGLCGHKFCEPCIKQYIKFKLDNFQKIMCPLQGCDVTLQNESVLWTRILSDQQKLHYEKIKVHFQILSDPNLRQCKNQKCGGIINFKEIRQMQIKNSQYEIKCPKCSMVYCALCQDQKHDGVCDKDIVKFLQRNKKFRQCNQCKRVIQKSQGCTHMTCLCGYYFCYMCGEQLKVEHTCMIPSHLTYLERVRWQIEHRQLFYESNYFSFHGILSSFDLSPDRNMALRVVCSLLYTLTIYPVSILLSILAIVLFFVLVTLVFTIFFTLFPLSQMCGRSSMQITKCLDYSCSEVGSSLCILIFYPIFIFAFMIESMQNACKDDQVCDDIQIVFQQIGQGLRNILLMPFVPCVQNQNNVLNQSRGTKQNPQDLLRT